MVSKVLTVILLATLAARLGLWQWKGLGEWFRRFVDVTLVVLGCVYAFQMFIMLSH